ncbi:hypothetical protein Q1695_002877 [Nippostrongylus brasiliensis]|nr:hypothetical protein Q1695_002877 [Nippostrongylus brasiliensis]
MFGAPISGGVFIAATLSMNFFNLFLLIQRGICIFLPFLTKRILSRTVVTVCTSAVFLFYLSVVAICVTPYFGAAFVPEHIVYAVLSELQYSIIVLRSNQFTNYVVMASNVIIYPILLIVLKCRKQFGNSAKQELRITTQVIVS